MDNQTREKEGNEERAAKGEIVLVMSGGLSKAEEEEKTTQEKNRVMIREHRPGEEGKVNDDEALWDWASEGFLLRISGLMSIHLGEFFSKVKPK